MLAGFRTLSEVECWPDRWGASIRFEALLQRDRDDGRS
jgi:hypothetical protein